jgi:hypothetical protein
VPSFPVSIVVLTAAQAALVALPRAARAPRFLAVDRRWPALIPPASIVVVIGLIAAYRSSADALTYLALVAVPPLAALALAGLIRGARPVLAGLAVPLFAVAWATSGSLAGETAALSLSALACVALGSALAWVVPRRWLAAGIYAMAAVDACLVVTDLLQGPNSVLAGAAPAASLPKLQVAAFGSAQMGFGDLFVAATAGALVAAWCQAPLGDAGHGQVRVAALALALGLAFDLLFILVDELPTTVPIAVALALSELAAAQPRGPRRKTSAWPPASGATRSGAVDVKATHVPSAEIDGR